jgi:hypothetical protein
LENPTWLCDRQWLIDGLRKLVRDTDYVGPNVHVIVADQITARFEQFPISMLVAHDRIKFVRDIDMNQACADT